MEKIMQLELQVRGTHDDLLVYHSEINNMFTTHGAPANYAVSISRRPAKRLRDDDPAVDGEAKLTVKEEADEDGGPKMKKRKTKGKGKGKSGKRQRGKNNGAPRYSGVIVKWNQSKNYWYVDCPELKEHFDCSVILQKSDVPRGAQQGSTISFIAMEAEGVRNPVAQEARLA
eukprot:GEMP01097126.1.p1 GENE.GEMP01097126.1~~GEMP01097126.1.p1  ORF type:complete len:190 (+),score=54.54 GEMP01097126.1:55-570(+)